MRMLISFKIAMNSAIARLYLHLLRLAHASHIASIGSTALRVVQKPLIIIDFRSLEEALIRMFLHCCHCKGYDQTETAKTGIWTLREARSIVEEEKERNTSRRPMYLPCKV